MATELTPQSHPENAAKAPAAEHSRAASEQAQTSLSSQAWHWTDNNIVRPAANALLVEPYSMVRNAVNTVASPFTAELLPEVQHLHTEQPKDTAGMVAQNLTSGVLGAAVLFGSGWLGKGALRGTAGLSRMAGLGSEAGEALAARPIIGELGGIATYESIRDPNLERGETRLSNTLGAVSAVAGFRAAHEVASAWPGATQLSSQFFAGGAGMMSGVAAGDLAQGKTPTSDELWNAGLYGGVLGVAMPMMSRRFDASFKTTDAIESSTAQTRATVSDSAKVSDTTKTSDAPAVAAPIESVRALSAPRSESTSLMVGDNQAGPFTDYADFRNRGIIMFRAPMKVYDIQGQPQTTIAFQDSAPQYARISPQQALGALEDLPDMRLVRRLSVFDDAHNQEPWLRQTVDPAYRIHGEVMPDSEMRLYQPRVGEDIPTTVRHEWNHLLKMKSPQVSAEFDKVGDLEPLRTTSRTVQSSSPEEQWSILGEGLLSKDPLLAPATASSNPVRATLWSEAMKSRLQDLPAEQRGTSDAFYRTLLDYIDTNVRPVAVERLTSAANSANTDSAARAREVLQFLQQSR